MPYRSKLTEPFEPGQTLIVKGKTAEDSVRSVNSIADFFFAATPFVLAVARLSLLQTSGNSPCHCDFFFSFTINLHTATADFSGNDVPLHISVRFDEGKVNK